MVGANEIIVDIEGLDPNNSDDDKQKGESGKSAASRRSRFSSQRSASHSQLVTKDMLKEGS